MRAVDAVGLAVELGQILERAKLPYAIGGALALGSSPRHLGSTARKFVG